VALQVHEFLGAEQVQPIVKMNVSGLSHSGLGVRHLLRRWIQAGTRDQEAAGVFLSDKAWN
jgi:hypothetical protein